ncbi:MAG: ABC transporter permease [Candidatus Ratteibacteria bacterium]
MFHAKYTHIKRLVKFGIKNIWLHKLRSLLTVLGIVFGVASVIAMLAIGEGASFEAREKIKELGSNNIIIRSFNPPADADASQSSSLNVFGLTPVDLRRIKTIPSVENVVPTWELKETIWFGNAKVPGTVVGTVPSYANVYNLAIPSGRFITPADQDNFQPVAVIGAGVNRTLFTTEPPIGKRIKIKSGYFTVVGVVGERAFQAANEGFEADDMNMAVYIPLTTSRAFFGEYEVKKGSGGMRSWERSWVKFHRFVARVVDTGQIMQTSAIIRSLLDENRKKTDYEILVPIELLKQAEHTKRIFSIVLGSIAAISLLVGGIGIMNIMLATVTERTREIGIRRALGAKQADIIHQFLTEAVLLSASGGFLGVAIGIIVPKMVTHFAGMTTLVTSWSVIVSFAISVAVGVLFGIYPARRAALLDPIQALRHE